MSSPSGASHIHSGKFARWCKKDNAVHCGHLPLHGDCQAKCGQVKSPYPLVGKTYNKCSVDQPHSCPKTTITLATILMKARRRWGRVWERRWERRVVVSNSNISTNSLSSCTRVLGTSCFHLFSFWRIFLRQFDCMRVKITDWASCKGPRIEYIWPLYPVLC